MANEIGMGCPSGKSSFQSEEIALEALVQNHIRFQHRKGAGPQSVYQCDECDNWHFTSRLPSHPTLLDSETQRRIANESRAQNWEHKLR